MLVVNFRNAVALAIEQPSCVKTQTDGRTNGYHNAHSYSNRWGAFTRKRGLDPRSVMAPIATCYACQHPLAEPTYLKKRKRIGGKSCENVKGVLEEIVGYSLRESQDYLCHKCHSKLSNIVKYEYDAQKLRLEVAKGVRSRCVLEKDLELPLAKRQCMTHSSADFAAVPNELAQDQLTTTSIQCASGTHTIAQLPDKQVQSKHVTIQSGAHASPSVTVSRSV